MRSSPKQSIFCILFSGLAFSAEASILPPNDWHKYDQLDNQANMTAEQFAALVDEVLDLYEPIIASHGGQLIRNKLWDDPTVNASAAQQGNEWVVNMYGGLARRPEVTPDGFSLVVCHELGHHLGGFPLKGERWAATEGQADYFATQACARAIWKDKQADNAKFRTQIAASAKTQCDTAWSSTEAQDLCYRIAAASHSLSVLLAAIGEAANLPDFSTPDQSQVDRTYESHPAAQCRLDTYMDGATCGEYFDQNTIPGKAHPEGQSSLGAELAAADSSCMEAKGQLLGLRSRCWFKPRLPFMAIYPEQSRWTEIGGNGDGSIDPGETATLEYVASNRTSTSVDDVVLKLSSPDPDLEIIQPQAKIGTITPGSSGTTKDEIQAKIVGSAPCGKKIPLQILASSNRGSSTSDGTIVVGTPRNDSIGTNPSEVPILNSAVVYSDIESSLDVMASKAKVSVNIDHAYMSDVILSLVAPDGSETLVARLPRVASKHIEADYELNLSGQKSLGLWRLKIEDTYRVDEGKLNSWSLALESYTCQ